MFFVLMVLKSGSSCKNPRAAGYVATPLPEISVKTILANTTHTQIEKLCCSLTTKRLLLLIQIIFTSKMKAT